MNHCEGCNGCKIDEKLEKIAKKYKNVEGGIISALHEVQDTYGYISSTAQKYLSKELNVPMSEIYGIITFYSRFSLVPKGKYNIQVCMGTACYVKGAQQLLDKMCEVCECKVNSTSDDGLFSIDATRCLGACGLAPVMIIDGKVHGNITDLSSMELLINEMRAMEA